MMCLEPTSDFSEQEPHEEPEKVAKKSIEKMEKQKTWRRTSQTYTIYKQPTKKLDRRI